MAAVSHNGDLVRLFFPDTAISNLLRLSDNVFGKETRELLLGRVQSSLDREAKLDPRLVSMIVVGRDELCFQFPSSLELYFQSVAPDPLSTSLLEKHAFSNRIRLL